MIVGFTGTQTGMTDAQWIAVRALLSQLRTTEVHHGDCVGADAEFHEIARAYGLRIVIHPPSTAEKRAFCFGNEVRQPAPYLLRDADIVEETDCLIGVPASFKEVVRSGTWFTIRRARRAGKKVYIVYPDGKVVEEGAK